MLVVSLLARVRLRYNISCFESRFGGTPHRGTSNNDPTPMDKPLRDQPEVETVHDDDEDTAPHLRERQKGTSTEEDYLKFVRDSLATNNPV